MDSYAGQTSPGSRQVMSPKQTPRINLTGRGPTALNSIIASKMRLQRRRDTPCELKVRKLLHGIGLRYRVDYRPVKGIRRRADIVFPPAKVAVFMDGCFWHLCPRHASWPKNNAFWWRQKLLQNQLRDRETNRHLRQLGWVVLRFWEHEPPERVARKIAGMVRKDLDYRL